MSDNPFDSILRYLAEQGITFPDTTVTLILHNGSVHNVAVPEDLVAESADGS